MEKKTAWQESHRLVAMGQESEKALQKKVEERARRIAYHMSEGYSREEAEKKAGPSCFGDRPKAMVDELIDNLGTLYADRQAERKKAEERAELDARSQEVASAIRAQIGGQAFYMMGAKEYVCGYDGRAKCHYLQFRVMKNRVGELVRVLLEEGTDTYRVVIMRIRSLEVQLKADESGIYCDHLAASVGRMTGLAVTL